MLLLFPGILSPDKVCFKNCFGITSLYLPQKPYPNESSSSSDSSLSELIESSPSFFSSLASFLTYSTNSLFSSAMFSGKPNSPSPSLEYTNYCLSSNPSNFWPRVYFYSLARKLWSRSTQTRSLFFVMPLFASGTPNFYPYSDSSSISSELERVTGISGCLNLRCRRMFDFSAANTKSKPPEDTITSGWSLLRSKVLLSVTILMKMCDSV